VSHLGPRLSAFIDGELSHPQRERVLAHLARCEPCRREAAALRALKQRMHALGEATADTALTERLIAVAGVGGPAPWRRRPLPDGRRPVPGSPRPRWRARSLAIAGLALAGLGVPAAAFLAGGGQRSPGPSVTPAIDMFLIQHELSTGNAPVLTVIPRPAPSPASSPAAQSAAAPAAPAGGAPSGPGLFTAIGAAASAHAAALTRLTSAAGRVTPAAGRAPPRPVSTAAAAR
jgi:Putative zinc-finger